MKTYVLLLLLFMTETVFAQTDSAAFANLFAENSDFFTKEEPFFITLKSNFKQLKKSKRIAPYQDAEIHTYTNGSIDAKARIQIKARGKYRKQTCVFPPIQLAIPVIQEIGKKPDLKKYKMVVHCNDMRQSETIVLKEFLCYKLYQCISDLSFHTRLIKVNYIDTGSKDEKGIERFAFLIEDLPSLASRLNLSVEDNKNLNQLAIQKECIIKLAMFQFMIGNFDWGIPTQRNVKLLSNQKKPKEIYAVPYDFDYCGMVNAYYAFPAEELKIKSVRERIYLGFCLSGSELETVIEEFIAIKAKFYETIDAFDYLDNTSKNEMRTYLDEFYQIINTKSFYKNYILSTCKNLNPKN
jgi:hypothetical protein